MHCGTIAAPMLPLIRDRQSRDSTKHPRQSPGLIDEPNRTAKPPTFQGSSEPTHIDTGGRWPLTVCDAAKAGKTHLSQQATGGVGVNCRLLLFRGYRPCSNAAVDLHTNLAFWLRQDAALQSCDSGSDTLSGRFMGDGSSAARHCESWPCWRFGFGKRSQR